jgi:uncharacterized protein YqgC (DUF456 family)
MAVAWFALALLVMLVGLLGAVMPLLPGLPLVLAGAYLYALATGFGAGIGVGHLVLYTLIAAVVFVLTSLANLLGARAAGGSRAAVVFELLAGQAARRAVRSGLGAAVGLLVGRLTELAVSVGLIASFTLSVVTAGVLGTPR